MAPPFDNPSPGLTSPLPSSGFGVIAYPGMAYD